MDKYERPDNTEPRLAAEPTENAEATEPAEPIDRIEPVEPIDRIDPLDPMLRSEPAEPAEDESRLVRMITFSQHWPVRDRTRPHLTRPAAATAPARPGADDRSG
jgi:hypothetical protein